MCITYLNPLGSYKCLPSLTELYLNNNDIETLDGLSNVDFSELTNLHLFRNSISNIEAFKTIITFKKILKLLLKSKIENIEPLVECKFE